MQHARYDQRFDCRFLAVWESQWGNRNNTVWKRNGVQCNTPCRFGSSQKLSLPCRNAWWSHQRWLDPGSQVSKGGRETHDRLSSKGRWETKNILFLDKNLKLKRTHAYFSQVQCQLACTGAKYCDFYVWSPNSEAVKGRICVDAEFWASKVEKLKLFFDECLLPEIVDPRKCRNMPIRERASFTPRPESSACSVKRKLTRP